MAISTYLAPISKVKELITQLLISEFLIDKSQVDSLYETRIKAHFEGLKDSIYLNAETNYVDKVYRDSYYHYYSSKLFAYQRNCIRISLFNDKVDSSDFWDKDMTEKLRKNYLGFIVLRPTPPHLIGRSVISPLAKRDSDFVTCKSIFQTTANGQKFKIEGFPHSSQDNETITCAETTIWALMEYFSSKYSEYSPVLPSKIIKTLAHVSSERQVPSKGLNIAQMSFALREFGFGTRIYGKVQYGNDFESILNCYIESGIPLIIAMQNGRNIGHALLAIGREHLSNDQIDTASHIGINDPQLNSLISNKNIEILDIDSIERDIIFVDDNLPVYQRAKLSQPAIHYPDPNWHLCRITYFIAPLYTKIYLEAFQAKSYIIRFLLTGPFPLNDGTKIVLRCYLASSRSFKDKVSRNKGIGRDLKALLLETSMPKFIWIGEMSTKPLLKSKLANGIIILDATEVNWYYGHKPLVLAAYQKKYISPEDSTGKLENISLDLPNFSIYEHNLR